VRGSGLAFDVVGALQVPRASILTPLKLLLVPLGVVADALLVLIFYVISTFVFIYSLFSAIAAANIYRCGLAHVESQWLCSGASGTQAFWSSSTTQTIQESETLLHHLAAVPPPFHDGAVGTAIASGYFAVTGAALEI
jgi:hypothetical protein